MSTAQAKKRAQTWEEKARDVLTAALIHLEELDDNLRDMKGSPVDKGCPKCERAPIPHTEASLCLVCRIKGLLKPARVPTEEDSCDFCGGPLRGAGSHARCLQAEVDRE